MTSIPWQLRARHFRDLKQRLDDEGFEIVRAWYGRHLRLRIRRNMMEVTVTCSTSPSVPEHCLNATMQQARRGTKPP